MADSCTVSDVSVMTAEWVTKEAGAEHSRLSRGDFQNFRVMMCVFKKKKKNCASASVYFNAVSDSLES